jgi:hypothetical protein
MLNKKILLLLLAVFVLITLSAQHREMPVHFPVPGDPTGVTLFKTPVNIPILPKSEYVPWSRRSSGYIDTTYVVRFSTVFTDVNDWDSAYFVSGYTHNEIHNPFDPDNPALLTTMKIDYSGNVLWTRVDSTMRGDHFTPYNTSMVRLSDGNFLQIGSVANDYNNWKLYDWHSSVFTKFNTSGNTIWQKVYKDTTYLKSGDWPMGVVAEADGGYSIIALNVSDSKHLNQYDSTDIFLYADTTYIGMIRYDSLGNELYRKHHFIGGHPVLPSVGLLMKQSDGGYLAGGVNEYNGSNEPRSYYLLKTDSTFNWQWLKTFGQTIPIDPRLRIQSRNNGDYFFAIQSCDTPIYIDPYGEKWYAGYNQVGVMDSAFNILYDTMFVKKIALYFGGPGYYNSSGNVRGLDTSKYGELVFCTYANDAGAYMINMGNGIDFMWGNLIADFPNFSEQPYEMRRAHDGGYLIVGFSWRPGVGGWFVKTDTLGFALPNGGDTLYHIGFENADKEEWLGLKAFPNPFKHIINLQFEKLVPGDIEVTISDITGRIVLTRHYSNAKDIAITLNDLSNGLYLISVNVDQHRFYNHKLLKI